MIKINNSYSIHNFNKYSIEKNFFIYNIELENNYMLNIDNPKIFYF